MKNGVWLVFYIVYVFCVVHGFTNCRRQTNIYNIHIKFEIIIQSIYNLLDVIVSRST